MGSKGGSTTTSTQKLPKEFLTAYTNSLKMAGQAVSTPYQAYQGQLVAGLNPTQLQGLSNVNAAQGMALPAIQQGMDLTQEAAKGITPELYNQFYSPYVRDVADATQKNLLESNAQQMSGLKGSAIQAGAFGGDRGGVAAAEMARQQDLANGQTMANIWNQGYGQAMGLAGQQAQNYGAQGQQLAGLGTAAQGSVLQGAQAQMAAGAQQQSTEQAQLSAAYDQYMQRLAYPYQQAQFYANIAEGLGSTAGGSSSTTTPGPSWGSQILGGLGALGSIFSMSDERMKEDIQPIGELFDGQTVYRYRFKDDPKGETRIGLMAQDVERRKPSAVAQIDGIKGVDYHDATNDAASAGGLVPRSGGRTGFAEGGGLSFYPWGGTPGWVPEGKLEGGGSRIPDPPKPYDPGSLDDSWYDLKPLTSDQLAGLGKVTYSLGIPTGGSVYARGGLARAHYATGGADAVDDPPPSNAEVDAYVAEAAKKRGIDPDVAVRLWHAEGRSGDPAEAWRSKAILKDGERESSYSPLQLNVKGGVGEQMIKDTGVDPSKVSNWKPSVDYGLDWGKKHGWNDWMGAKAAGIAPREGLPDVEGGIAAASDQNPTADGGPGIPAGGLVVPGERPKFSLSSLFASDKNPNIIEGVMGHRMSPEARNAVMAASFAMLAGRSPFMGVNIGEAGKAGMQTYYNALKQKADVGKIGAETGKTGVEAEVLDLGMRQKIYNLYQMSKANYLINDNTGEPFMSFSQWAQKFGFPDLGIDDGAAPATDGSVKARPMPPPPGVQTGEQPISDGPNDATGKPGGPKYEVQPLGAPTVLADPSDGPSPSKPNTLPFWDTRMKKLTAAQGAAMQGGDPEFQASIASQLQQAQGAVNDIRGSEDYKNMTAFQSQYAQTLSGLEKLGKLNAEYEGGRLAAPKAEIVGILQSMGISVPAGWKNETANYDMVMKGALDLAIKNAANLGSLAHAPGMLMDIEGKITPSASLDPAARYDLVRRAVANLQYGHDLYATWDQGFNFGQHQQDFNRMNPYDNYLDHATNGLPMPKVFPGENVPGHAEAKGIPLPDAIQNALNAKGPNLPDGTKATGPGGMKAVKQGGVWVQVQ